jgi:hypothetical protein
MASIARRFAVMGQVDPDVAAWRDVVKFIGGSVSIAALSIASRFADREKASGAWDLTDDYWPFWGETLWQAIISLKQRRGANLINGPVHVPRRHISTNGTTSYIDTTFNPNLHKVAASTKNARLAIYLRDNGTSNNFAAGCNSTSNRNLRIRPRNAGNALLEPNASAGTYTLPVATSAGYTATSRDAAAGGNTYAYKNGVALVPSVVPAAFGTASLPNVVLYVGGSSNSGVFGGPRASQVGFMAFGATLSAAQELAQYEAVQEWATVIGANV